ncbi:hypothetical protein [Lacinutrix sp.]|uniref:hypothetical protein n=1 Tax=Lacinutrix sp. TaxID=1937692 RepID=UPI0025BCDEC7|nr:hypothetical protein [Lacinutrix sp.]
MQKNSLLNFQGLDSLTQIGGLTVVESGITNFQGLESLTQINPIAGNYNLLIDNNPNLLSLSGLDNLIFTQTADINIGGSSGFSSGVGNPLLTDFCALQSSFLNSSSVIENNAYNPTIQDIQNGNCSQ